MPRPSAVASAAALLSWLLLVTTNCAATEVQAPACNRTHLFCQLRAGAINCSLSARTKLAPTSDAAVFVRDSPSQQPNRVALVLLPRGGTESRVLTVASLRGLVACFLLTYDVNLRLVAGGAAFRLTPGAMDAFVGVRRLSLRLRLHQERVPAGVFTESLAELQNLQLDTARVSEIEPGAFKELRRLKRLSISNLRVSHLTSAALQGLGELKVLELQNNGLTNVDAASFSASPLLEYLDLRTGSVDAVGVAPDTFCGLTMLRQLQCPASYGVNCSHFASRQLHLTLSRGRSINCVRLLGQKSPCSRGTAGIAATSTPTAAGKAAARSTTATTATTITTTKTTVQRARPTVKLTTTATTTTVTTSQASTASPTYFSAALHLATPAAASAAATGGRIVAVSLIAAGLILLAAAAAIAAFAMVRRHCVLGVAAEDNLRRAPSRQPIFSPDAGLDADIDMQDTMTWNPVFQKAATATATDSPAENPE